MKDYSTAIEKAIHWITCQMLTFDHGYSGIYERIRIDEHTRTNWSRPDCNSEFLRVLFPHLQTAKNTRHDLLAEHILSWLERTQDKEPLSVWKGSFPFYVIDGTIREPKVGESIYQNDNGKILVSMCQLYKETQNERFLTIAEGVAGYWQKTQQPDGTFGVLDSKCMLECRKGPCFVQWLVYGFYLLYEATQDTAYLDTAEKGMRYLLSLQLENGRSRTTYEVTGMENWRPVSSETGILVDVLATAYRITKKRVYREKLLLAADYLLSLQHESGAVLNCKPGDEKASQQNNPCLCDLVYTAGFALQALYHAFEAAGEPKFIKAAFRLGDFLEGIQCQNESPLWDGGWRGSYHVADKKWEGRANQNNAIDEGGMYSVYTGWCCTNIVYGLQLLQAYEEKIKTE